MITGQALINGAAVTGNGGSFQAFDPSQRRHIEPAFHMVDMEQIHQACALAGAAFDAFRAVPAAELDSEKIQFEVYEVGKRHGYAADLKAWFAVLYEVLLGTQQGPRMGSFIAIYGVAETIALIGRVLAGEDLGRAA